MTSLMHKSPGPIRWMANNPVASNLLMLFFLVGGLVMLTRITQEFFPNIERDTVTVTVPYPGASPEEVEEGIVLAVEEALSGLDGVKEVTSTAAEGSGTVVAELYERVNQMKVYQDIESEVDRIVTFPEDSEDPIVTLDTRSREVVQVAIYGEARETSLRELAEQLRDRFLESPEITKIELAGIRPLEIGIEVSQDALRRYGISVPDIAAKVKRACVEIPAGAIKAKGGEVLVRMTERRDYGREFGQIPIISTPDGGQVFLKDIAEINDGFEDSDRFAVHNGKPAVMLEVYRIGNQTPVSVSAAVREQMELVRDKLPDGIQMAELRNMAEIYHQRARLLIKNGIMGLCLVMILLGFFLEIRLAFWVMMGIPISFLGAMLFMPALGLSLNMMSMFAFIVALGIVVDDAIVVGENVYRLHQDGMSFIDAAVAGTREVSMPVTFSILTNIAAFIPLALLPGIMGKVMWMLPAVVITAFSISWIECLFVLPSHLGHQKDIRNRRGALRLLHEFQQNFSHWFVRHVRIWYGPFLKYMISNRYAVVCFSAGIFLFIMGFVMSGRMGFDMFPRVESDYAYAYLKMPYGTPVETSRKITERMLRAAEEVVRESRHPELCEGMFADVGKNGSHTSEIRVYLAKPEIRKAIMSTQRFVDAWREKTGEIPGAESLVFQSDRGGPGGGSALTVELKHRNLEILEKASGELAGELQSIPIVSDIDDGFQPGKEQLDFRMKPEGESLGLTAQYVAAQLRGSYEGTEVLRQQRGRNEIKIKVRRSESERDSEHGLNTMIINTPGGAEALLRDIVEIKRGRAYTDIARRNGQRTVDVTADVRPRSKVGEVMQVLDKDVMPKIISRYAGLTYSYQGRQSSQRESLSSLSVLIPIVMMAIYAMLAIPFKSYVQPLIVMTSIPFGVIGAILGHLIMGYGMSLISLIGILALSGVVVNDSLVLIDFANRSRKSGKSAFDAVHGAGIQRFRPILLTTLTTFGGLLPMIFETSRQARFLIPLAISLGYGILFATLITLVLVPSLYMIVEDIRGYSRI